jgi:hypothetical protein
MNALALSAAAVALLITSFGAPAEAAYVVDLTQVADPSQPLGFDVVATGSGSIDLAGLSSPAASSGAPFMDPGDGGIQVGGKDNLYAYSGVTGPVSFGTGGSTGADTYSGFPVGVSSGELYVDRGYVSGDQISSTTIWTDASFASLGVTPGTYKWTWGTGANADSFTLDIVAVPEPSTWALMLVGFGLLGGAGYLTRHRSVAIAA